MAFSKITKDMNIIAALDDEPNDVGGLSAAQLKAKFDEGGLALKTFINNWIDAIAEGTAAANIGAKNANDETDTLQNVLDDLIGAAIGTIPDGAVTTAKLHDGAVTNAKIADSTIKDAKFDWANSAISRIEVLTYSGTNTYGPDHPCSVTFTREPKLVFIFTTQYAAAAGHAAILNYAAMGASGYFVRIHDTSTYTRNEYTITNNRKTLTWYANAGDATVGVQMQMNESGTHTVIAFS